MLNLVAIIEELATERPVFHSEADFQHALAWKLHIAYPQAEIRLEFPVSLQGAGQRVHVDMLLKLGNSVVVIELKYLTRALNTSFNDEHFVLANHGAHNHRSYDAVKDIERLESLVGAGACCIGYACVLTNDPQYWNQQRRSDRVDNSQIGPFRLTDGRDLAGSLQSKMKSPRDKDINLRGTYTLGWNNYSGTKGQPDRFRFTLVRVGRSEDELPGETENHILLMESLSPQQRRKLELHHAEMLGIERLAKAHHAKHPELAESHPLGAPIERA